MGDHLPYQPRPRPPGPYRISGHLLAGVATGLSLAAFIYAAALIKNDVAILVFGIFIVLPLIVIVSVVCLALSDKTRQFARGLLLSIILLVLLVIVIRVLR